MEKYVGCDEVNKSSIFGTYFFISFYTDNTTIKKIEEANLVVDDSKNVSSINNEKIYYFTKKEFSQKFNIYPMLNSTFDLLKTKLNLNELTLIGHLISINQLANKIELNGINIIIDDFMANQTNKLKFVINTIQKYALLAKTQSLPPLENIQSSLLKKINFIEKAESKYKGVAVASQIGSHLYNLEMTEIANLTKLPLTTIISSKNIFSKFTQWYQILKPDQKKKLLKRYIRTKFLISQEQELMSILNS